MNFLAHLYLSKSNKNILIGNFIADAVKGNKHNNYPFEIQAGILLHREIDTYTDNHPIVRKSKRRLHQRYNHYNGVIIDILYDHYLAKNWAHYSEIPLEVYANSIYSFLNENAQSFPLKIQQILPYMVEHNWLVAYATIEGIGKILCGMNKRTKGISKMDLATEDLKLYYHEFENDFTTFFKDLEQFTNQKTTLLTT
jgi:acyl carrier protein phosphodiesterase